MVLSVRLVDEWDRLGANIEVEGIVPPLNTGHPALSPSSPPLCSLQQVVTHPRALISFSAAHGVQPSLHSLLLCML
jgi:hypothetical protein